MKKNKINVGLIDNFDVRNEFCGLFLEYSYVLNGSLNAKQSIFEV